MRLNLLTTLLATTALVAFSAASDAEAGGLKYGNHTFGGKFTTTFGSNTNVGKAPASAAGGFDDEDEDYLEDLIDDQDQDDEDLADDEDDDPSSTDAGTRILHDERMQYGLGLNHKYAFSKDFSWNTAALAGANRQFSQTNLDRNNWAVSTGPEFKFGSVSINPNVTYAELAKNGKNQSESVIGGLAAKWKVSKTFGLNARYTHEARNNLRTTDIEADGLKVGATYLLTPKDKFAIAFSPKIENNDKGSKNKQKYGYDVGYARKLPWDITAALAMKYSRTEFTGAGQTREDDDYQYGLSFGREFKNGLFANVGGAYKSKVSNIDEKGGHDKGLFVQAGYKF